MASFQYMGGAFLPFEFIGTNSVMMKCKCSKPLPSSINRYRRERGPKTMPDRNRNIRDHKRRLLAAKYELRRKLYKALCQDPGLPPALREKFRMKLSKLPRNSAFTRVRNRCIFTGRGRAIIRKFKMSRICFRTVAGHKQLMGISKSSW